MAHRPAIDTLEAKRALEEAGLDPGVSGVLLRLIDTGIHNSTVDRAELEILRKQIVSGRIKEWTGLAILVATPASVVAFAQGVMPWL